MKRWSPYACIAAIVMLAPRPTVAQINSDLLEQIDVVKSSVVQVVQADSGPPGQGGPGPGGFDLESIERMIPLPPGVAQQFRMVRQRTTALTAIAIDRPGLFLTVSYTRPSDEMELVLEGGKRIPAKLRVYDELSGCAILKADEDPGLQVLMPDFDALPLGMPLAVIYKVDAEVIRVGAGIAATNVHWQRGLNLPVFETDIAIQPGASGGAVIDSDGNLRGVIIAMGTPFGMGGPSTVVPISVVQPLLNTPADGNEVSVLKRGAMGAVLDEPQARVSSVNPDSPAARADIKSGDVIVQIDDQEVHGVSQVMTAIAMHRAGDQVKVQVERDGQRTDATVELQAVESNRSGNGFNADVQVFRGTIGNPNLPGMPPGGEGEGEVLRPMPFVPQFNVLSPPRIQVERSDLEESIRELRKEIDSLRKDLRRDPRE